MTIATLLPGKETAVFRYLVPASWLVLALALPAHAATTIAIGYFDNTSGAADWQPLSKGLADMLITDLAATDGLVVVERERLQQVVDEIKLGQGKFIDPSTAQKMGKGLGASHMLIGGFLVSQGKLRVDARLVDVASGKIGLVAQETGSADDVFAVEAKLADKLRQSLSVTKKRGDGAATPAPKVSADDVKTLGQGLDAMDQGKVDEARRLLGALAARRPDFTQVQRGLDALSKRIKLILAQNKVAPERLVALMAEIESGKVEACQKLMMELSGMMTAVVKAGMRVQMPDGGDAGEAGRLLAAFYAVLLHAVDQPALQAPICYGQQPAGTVTAMFLMSMQHLAQLQLKCDPVRLAQDPNAERQRGICEKQAKRMPDMVDPTGKVVVAAKDYPVLMVQVGQIFVERYAASPYAQTVLPQIQEYVDHFRIANLSAADKEKALATARTEVTRKAIAQFTAYADLGLAMGLIPASPQMIDSSPGVGLFWSLHLSEGDMTVGLGNLELSADGGKTWHAWPRKDEAPGWAYKHLNFPVNPGKRRLVAKVDQLVDDATGNKVPKWELLAKKWVKEAVWLDTAPWTPERYAQAQARLTGEDGSPLGLCTGKYDEELSKRGDGKPVWYYGRLFCRGN